MDPTAAPVDLELEGKTYQAYPLRDIDHEAMNKWVRREYVARTKDSVAGDEDLLRLVLSQSATMAWLSEDGLRLTLTVAGLTKLLSLLCRGQKLPPREVLLKEESLSKIFEAFQELHAQDENMPAVEHTGGSAGGKK